MYNLGLVSCLICGVHPPSQLLPSPKDADIFFPKIKCCLVHLLFGW